MFLDNAYACTCNAVSGELLEILSLGGVQALSWDHSGISSQWLCLWKLLRMTLLRNKTVCFAKTECFTLAFVFCFSNNNFDDKSKFDLFFSKDIDIKINIFIFFSECLASDSLEYVHNTLHHIWSNLTLSCSF